jgi:hypothetical protein
MKAITTKYLGPTNYRGARVVAKAEGGLRLAVAWDDTLGVDDNHTIAARMLAEKMEWCGQWCGGGLPDSTGNAYVRLPISLEIPEDDYLNFYTNSDRK